MIQRAAWTASAALLLVVALACGESEPSAIARGPGANADPPRVLIRQPIAEPSDGNRAPEIRGLRFEPVQPAADEPLRVIADTFDADGDFVHLSYRWFYQGREVTGDSDQVTFFNSRKQDWIEVRVTPSDGQLEGQIVKAETRVANRAPSAITLRMETSRSLQAGVPIVARPYSHDYDGDGVVFEYSWTLNGIAQAVEGNTFLTAGLKRGDKIRVRVIATDGEAHSPPVTSEEFEIQNAPPEIVSRPTGIDRGGSFDYQLDVKDPDSRRFSYRLVRAPKGMDIDLVSGRIRWKPRPGQRGTYPIEIVVDDRSGGRSYQSFELTLHGPEAGPASR